MHNPTNLESLLNELNEFKKEMFLFIGDASEYQRKHVDNPESYREKRVKWISEQLNDINCNFKNQGIELDVSGLVQYDGYGYSITYKPTFTLKTESLFISYKTGFFSNKFKVYNLEKDFLQVEPRLKVKKTLNELVFQEISELLQTGIAEVAQHRFGDFKIKHQKTKDDITYIKPLENIVSSPKREKELSQPKKIGRLNYEL